jgi:hypothetical protein
MYIYISVCERGGKSGTRMERGVYYRKLIEILTILKIRKSFLSCTRCPCGKLTGCNVKRLGGEKIKWWKVDYFGMKQREEAE